MEKFHLNLKTVFRKEAIYYITGLFAVLDGTGSQICTDVTVWWI